MRITYIDHDGFLLETEQCCLLFDYWKGELPQNISKPLYIFASHHHPDHFTPEIFSYGKAFPGVRYLLADDIRSDFPANGVTVVSPDGDYTFPELSVHTLRSTDQGVAFLVKLATGETIYHAGDLHLWLFGRQDTPEEAEDMTERFCREIDRLRGKHIDAAFLPLDPRQPRDQYWLGLDYCARNMDIDHIFPMHMWGRYGIIEKFKAIPQVKDYADKIITIEREGQSYEI